jgi:hypothetical protein
MAVLAVVLITRIVLLLAGDLRAYAEFPFGGMNSRLTKNNSRLAKKIPDWVGHGNWPASH